MIFAGVLRGAFEELPTHLCLDEEGVLLLLERDLDRECLRFSSFLSEKGKAESKSMVWLFFFFKYSKRFSKGKDMGLHVIGINQPDSAV